MGSDQKRANKPQKPETQHKARDKQVARPKPSNLDNLQQQVGNRAVQRLVAQREGGEGDYKLDSSTTRRIERERGGGQPIDGTVQREMGQTMGQDVSDVRVHTDAEADRLNRQLDARAFTVGRDVFFRDGDYNPHSSDGQELLAHELTHAVDQRAGVVQDSGGATVHAPNDAHERRADDVAKQVTDQQTTGRGKQASARRSVYAPGKGMATSAIQRQETPEEEIETKAIQRHEEPEEEIETKAVQRQEEPEEEIETKAVQRQEEPEEEIETKAVQRQEIPEEELEVQTLQRQEEPDEEIETKAIQRQEIPEEELEVQTLQRQEEPEEEIETKR
jgi:hypothetical protein